MVVVDPNIRVRLDAIRQMPVLLSENERIRQSIKNVKKDGYVRIEQKVYRVDGLYRYVVSKNDEWYELALYCLSDGSKTFLEWYDDDGLNIYIQESELTMEETGVTREDLRRWDDEESGSFTFRGITYKYSDSDNATFYREPSSEGEKLYYWDFEGANSTLVGFERWESTYKAYLSRELGEHDVEVLSLGGAE